MLNYKKYNPPPVSLCYAFTFLNAVLLTLIGISATYGGQKKTALSHGDNSLITSGLQLRRDLQSQYLLKERQSDEARKNLQRARRKVFLDLGGKTFSSSTQWFMQMYPLVFDDIHAFEVRKGVYRIPKGGDGLHDSKSPTLVQDALDKVTLHEGVYVSHKDLRSALNITRWMIEDLKLQPEDAVIVKMDIEEAEWPILHYWAENPQMGELVDELFVEIHYKHESMFEYGWPWTSSNHTREEATSLLHNLRANGIYAHAWP